jgi:hypothetical protein
MQLLRCHLAVRVLVVAAECVWSISKEIEMSRDKDEGGDAFPSSRQRGMTLRDYFAAKALQGMISTSGHPALLGLDGCELDTAKAAYKMADAMLAARNK